MMHYEKYDENTKVWGMLCVESVYEFGDGLCAGYSLVYFEVEWVEVQ